MCSSDLTGGECAGYLSTLGMCEPLYSWGHKYTMIYFGKVEIDLGIELLKINEHSYPFFLTSHVKVIIQLNFL